MTSLALSFALAALALATVNAVLVVRWQMRRRIRPVSFWAPLGPPRATVRKVRR